MCHLCAAARPGDASAFFDTHAATAAASAPTFRSLDRVANYLVEGFWNDGRDDGPHAFNVQASGRITYNISGLSAPEQAIARAALQAWTDVSGLRFRASDFGGDILFTNSLPNASTSANYSSGQISTSYVNVASDWLDDAVSLNSYWFQTYMHEIGHALGLGHAGNYNGSDDDPVRTFPADSWQVSVMSYFDQIDTPRDDGDFAYLATVMPADILAIQKIYGTDVHTREGNTVYGANSNVTGYLGRMFAALFDFKNLGPQVDLDYPAAMTLYDTGGTDTLDVSTMQGRQRIDLNPYAASDVGGIRGSVVIGPNTVIENAIGGRGVDFVIGNGADNRLQGNGGNDSLSGRSGDDTLSGGAGDDLLIGGAGHDTARYYGRTAVRVDLDRSGAQSTGLGRDHLVAIEDLQTGGGADRLFGTKGANQLQSGAGRDRLSGRYGDDMLIGGSGDDILWGNAGNDTLRGQTGDDTMAGGYGRDTFVFAAGRDVITDFDPVRDTLILGRSLWDGAAKTVQAIVDSARHSHGDLIFRFADGHALRLEGLADTSGLADAIDIL